MSNSSRSLLLWSNIGFERATRYRGCNRAFEAVRADGRDAEAPVIGAYVEEDDTTHEALGNDDLLSRSAIAVIDGDASRHCPVARVGAPPPDPIGSAIWHGLPADRRV